MGFRVFRSWAAGGGGVGVGVGVGVGDEGIQCTQKNVDDNKPGIIAPPPEEEMDEVRMLCR